MVKLWQTGKGSGPKPGVWPQEAAPSPARRPAHPPPALWSPAYFPGMAAGWEGNPVLCLMIILLGGNGSVLAGSTVAFLSSMKYNHVAGTKFLMGTNSISRCVDTHKNRNHSRANAPLFISAVVDLIAFSECLRRTYSVPTAS